MKSSRVEMLLKDLLHITTRETDKLPEILSENFTFFSEEIVRILRDEYQKPKNDWRIICGCFSVICGVSNKYPKIGDKDFQTSYPLLNKGLIDKRITVKRFAALAVLNIICRIYREERFIQLGANNDKVINAEIDAEVRELKKNIKSEVFLESFKLVFPNQLEKRLMCESAGIKEVFLVEVSKYILG